MKIRQKNFMNSMKTCPSVTFYFMKSSFSDISRKCILPNTTRTVAILIIFGNVHFLLISERVFDEIKHDGRTSLMDSMTCPILPFCLEGCYIIMSVSGHV